MAADGYAHLAEHPAGPQLRRRAVRRTVARVAHQHLDVGVSCCAFVMVVPTELLLAFYFPNKPWKEVRAQIPPDTARFTRPRQRSVHGKHSGRSAGRVPQQSEEALRGHRAGGHPSGFVAVPGAVAKAVGVAPLAGGVGRVRVGRQKLGRWHPPTLAARALGPGCTDQTQQDHE